MLLIQAPDVRRCDFVIYPQQRNQDVIAHLLFNIVTHFPFIGKRREALIIGPEQLTIQANNPEQEEAEEVVPVEFNGDELEIGFNVSYLLDVLGVLDTDDVKLSVSDANSSALIEGIGNESAVYVVMPMRL